MWSVTLKESSIEERHSHVTSNDRHSFFHSSGCLLPSHFLYIMGSLAQMEQIIAGGRKRALANSKLDAARKLLDDGIPRKDVAEIMKISMATLYRYLPGEQL